MPVEYWPGEMWMLIRAILLITITLVTACTASSAAPAVTNEPIDGAVGLPVAQAATATVTPTPPATPTPAGPITLTIWWPEPLDNSDAADILSQQISAFQAANDDVLVQLRLKTVSDVGSIMPTLRTASAVAPGALPDLTLLRRADLESAVTSGLVYSLEGLIPSAVQGNLYTPALNLGQVDNTLYGLPYALEVFHMAAQADRAPAAWRFSDVLDAGVAFVFPAGQPTSLSPMILPQYVDAGGSLDTGGTLTVDADAVLTLLSFYEAAIADGLIDPAVLDNSSTFSYLDELIAGDIDAGLVSSTQYLDMMRTNTDLTFGSIPTATGQTAAHLDGWMWVLTTTSADQRNLAARFLDHMMDVDQQAAYTQAVHMLPSQRAALQAWGDSVYASFAGDLLNRAIIPLPDSSALARALQSAIAALFEGDATAAELTDTLVTQLGG